MRWGSFGCQRLEQCGLLGQAPFDELALEVRQLRLQQAAIAADVVAVRTDTRKIFVEHHRHS
jgi:outer membrane murein-binding lipoprotein Lpp